MLNHLVVTYTAMTLGSATFWQVYTYLGAYEITIKRCFFFLPVTCSSFKPLSSQG
jgi:hypothetical protein